MSTGERGATGNTLPVHLRYSCCCSGRARDALLGLLPPSCPVWQWNKPRSLTASRAYSGPAGRSSAARGDRIAGRSDISHSEAALVATTRARLEHTAIPPARPRAVLGIAPQTRNG